MKSFLQSKQWADFQKSLGRKVWFLDNLLVIKYNLPFDKSYLYSPRCGLFNLEKIKEIAKKENSIFFKIEPLGKVKGFRKSHDLQPRKTLILDLVKEDLLEKMHSKTRYNIKLAEKKGVVIKKGKFEDFWRLTCKTTKRDNFKSHPKDYYKKMLNIPGVELFAAEYKGKVIVCNIVMFFEKQAIYLHGASDYSFRNVMAPFLLQWKQILEARKRKCEIYDFRGIDEKKWPGITRFKKGFNGQEVISPGAYDFVFNPLWYFIYKVGRKIL